MAHLLIILSIRPKYRPYLGLSSRSFPICKATGVRDDRVQKHLKFRLLLTLEEDRFDREDVGMGKLLARGFSRGLRIEDVIYYVQLGEKIVDHEMELRRRLTHHLPYNENAALKMEMVQNARMNAWIKKMITCQKEKKSGRKR
jgi:hypothetical protein